MADVRAFYLPTDDPSVFVATPHTLSLWAPDQEHGGPPSALLTRAMELVPSSVRGPSQLVRITVEILGPVPTGEVRVSAAVTRPGRSVELLEAELVAGGRVALRARAWRIRTEKIVLPVGYDPRLTVPPPLPGPEAAMAADPSWGDAYLSVVEFRFVRGHFDQPGPAAAWIRPGVELVAGEALTPMQRLMAVADSGNGMSSELPFDKWWYINTELTVHLHRAPVGEWIYMDANTTLDPSGVGLATTVLADLSGQVARGAQGLMVGPR
jgi:hypothetical protein